MVVGAVAAVFSAVTGFIGKRKQQKEMREAASRAQNEERKQRAIANRQAALERQRSIRQAIAQSRVTRAQVINQTFGVGGSAAEGAGSAIMTDAGTAIGASQTQFAAQSGIAASQNRQSQAMQDFQNAQGDNFWTTASQIGGMVSSVAGIKGGGSMFGVGGK
jgi:hypothetical protein